MKINAISIYKGLAILMVFMIHTASRFSIIEPFNSITKIGDLGCQIFFTISAFCLCLSFEDRKEKYKKFVIRRLKRVAPGYWLTIILTLILALFCGKEYLNVSLKPFDIFANVALLNGLCPQSANNHVVRGGWFIGTLVILYMLFPILYQGYKNMKTNSRVVFLSCLLILIFNFIFWLFVDSLKIPYFNFNHSYFFYFSFLNQLSSFVLGFYLYTLYIKNIKDEADSHNSLYYILFLISFGLLILFKYGKYEYRDIFTPFFMSLSFVYLFMITYRFFSRINFFSDKLINVGNHSYGMYLLNTFIAWDVGSIVSSTFEINNQTLVYLVWFPVSVIILYYLSFYYEKVINLISKIVFK